MEEKDSYVHMDNDSLINEERYYRIELMKRQIELSRRNIRYWRIKND